MKVLHVISSGGMYGAEAVVLALCRAHNRLAPGSASLAVFHNTAQPNLELYHAALAAGIGSHLIESSGRIDPHTPARLRNLAHDASAGIVHTHGYKADVYGYLAMRRTGVPLVSTCHNWCDTDWATRAYGMLDRLALRRFDAVAAVSQEVQQRLTRSGVPANLVRVVRNGIDLRPFRPRDQQDEHHPLKVGFAGRLSHEKGIDIFLQVAATVLDGAPDTLFVVAGDGPERASVERTVAEKGFGQNIQLLGHRADMPGVYPYFDLLLSTSRTEGLPIGLMEAMACAVPVVATEVGDVPVLIEHGKSGLLVKPGEVNESAEAVLRLLSNKALRKQLGSAGMEKVQSEFSDDAMLLAYLDFYGSVVSHSLNAATQI